MRTNIIIPIAFVTIMFFYAGCGSGTINNESLGKLPGIAKMYAEKIHEKEKDLKECTDMKISFKLNREIELLGDEAHKSIAEYLSSNPIHHVPFEQDADYRFKIKELAIENASNSRIHLKAKVTVTEDIKNKWGGFEKSFFAFVQAVDKEGKSLTRRHGVMMNYGRGPFKTGMEVEMSGSIDGPADLVTFEKMVFVTKK